jgi:YD repeat-containing protein
MTSSGTTTFTVQSTTNRMASSAISGVTLHAYSYLTGGRALSQDGGTNTYAYTYNAARRMTEVTETVAGLMSETNGYAYDRAAHGVWNLSGSTQTTTTYDLAGHYLQPLGYQTNFDTPTFRSAG